MVSYWMKVFTKVVRENINRNINKKTKENLTLYKMTFNI